MARRNVNLPEDRDEQARIARLTDPDVWRSLAGFASPDLSVEPGEVDATVYDA